MAEGRQSVAEATDWDRYYANVPPTAKLTRRYTTGVLLDAMKRHATPANPASGLSIVEIGGANSCFLGQILQNIPCESYDIFDTNAYGLSLTARQQPDSRVHLHNESVLSLNSDRKVDLVFSVGLVEHFDTQNTRRAILAHLDLLRPGGTLLLTFPTPTLLYRATRGFLESIGQWRFPDERPLEFEEVAQALNGRAKIVDSKILWPLMLTQHLLVAHKLA